MMLFLHVPWPVAHLGARCLSAVCLLQVRAGIPHAVAVTSQASVNPAQHLPCPRLLCAEDSGPLSFRRSPLDPLLGLLTWVPVLAGPAAA